MEPDTASYHIPSFYFRVTIPDIAVILCSEVSGLDPDMDQTAYRSGDSIIRLPKTFGLRRAGDITLHRIITDHAQAITAWHDAVRCNNIRRKNITVELLDEERNAVKRWHAINAWPKKISAASAESHTGGAAPAFGTIILAHEGVTEE